MSKFKFSILFISALLITSSVFGAWDKTKPANDEKLKDTPALIRANWEALELGTDSALQVTNAKVSATAGIVDTKLAQITTASKVSGTALTGLANIPAGAGVIPVANIPDLAASKITTGQLAIARGGTNLSSAGGSANRVLLTTDGSTFAMGQVNLTSMVTGTLPTGNGGTGSTANANAANGVCILGANAYVPTANLGSGTPSASTYLRGDQSWQTIASSNYSNLICSFLSADANGFTAPSTDYVVCFTGKFTKTASISTITFYARGRIASSGAARWIVKLNIGGLYTELPNGTGSEFMEQSGTLNVSSLTNGTVYDITVSLKSNVANVESTLSKLFAYAS